MAGLLKPEASWSDYSSSVIFWCYIVAALYFSMTAIQVVYSLPGRSIDAVGQHQARHVYTLIFFACISFATLSANMLNILVQSYLRWSEEHFITSSVMSRMQSIMQWSLQTKQFHEFINALFEDQPGFVWSIAALVATFFVCVYIGIEGERLGIPKLWAFFGLSQILPISFSASLFFVATARSAKPIAPVSIRWGQIVASLAAFLVLTYTCRFLVLADKAHDLLMPIVLLARSLLLIPYVAVTVGENVKRSGWTREDMRRMLRISLILMALSIAISQAETLAHADLQEAWQSLIQRPTTATLACDFVLTVIICLFWSTPPARSGTNGSLEKKLS